MELAQNRLGSGVSPSEKIRVMLVDDSAVVRGLITRWLGTEKDIEIVAQSRNGLQAIKDAQQHKPQVIVLDIEMPEMDGLEALPSLLKSSPNVRVLIASSLSQRHAKISLTALSKGAHDYVPKPTTNSGLTTSDDFRTELIAKIYALCGRSRTPAAKAAPSPQMGRPAPLPSSSRDRPQPSGLARPAVGSAPAPASPATNLIRNFNARRPSILCIGSSTGGPRAVQTFLTELAPKLRDIPIVITQHMPKTFTTVFAEHLGKATSLPVVEAEAGMVLEKGKVYVAPGDRHMVFARSGVNVEVVLDDGPEVNYCKPAVDRMFDSAAEIYAASTLAVVLTGMGNDGAKGGETIVKAGGNVVAQDEASSIVWGMPGAAYKAGVCCGMFPLNEMAKKVGRIVQEGQL